jgi:hypothetical protein
MEEWVISGMFSLMISFKKERCIIILSKYIECDNLILSLNKIYNYMEEHTFSQRGPIQGN